MSESVKTKWSAENPLLTVSVAAYNAEEWLGRCLDSCLGFDNIEVIVVDDGSTDGTASVAERYVKKAPETFRLIRKENGHYGSTVNASLPEARGKYYRLLDSDDWFNRDGLRCWLDVLARTESDVAVTTSMRVMEKSGEEFMMEPCPGVPDGDYVVDSLPVKKIPGPGISNLAWRTGFLREIGLSILERCNYVDEELRCIPWCYVRTVRVDHYVVYCVLKEREGQNTSLEGLRRSAGDKACMFQHLMATADLGEKGRRSKAQEMALAVVVNDIAVGYYSGMLLLTPSHETKQALIAYDAQLKHDYPEIFALAGEYRMVRFLRASRFALYAPLARHRVRKWKY